MKTATVYKRRNSLLLHSNSQTTSGVWIAAPPFVKLDAHEEPATIGQAVIKTLEASQASVSHPTKWDRLFEPMLEIAGVKSWAGFIKGASCVEIDLENGRLTISPNKNNGAQEGFTPSQGKDIHLPADASPHEVGMALDRAFSLCERG
jgi:hypothetical protein